MLSSAVARRADTCHSDLGSRLRYGGSGLDGNVRGMKIEACVAISDSERDVFESFWKRFS